MKILSKINIATIFFGVSAVFVTIVCATSAAICAVFPLFSKTLKMNIVHQAAKNWGTILTCLVFPKFNITGIENYDKNKTYIITPNHQGSFDIFFMLHILKGKYCFVSKDAYFKYPLIGYTMRKSGYILVDRTTSSAAKMIDEAVDRLQNERSILMYPEGSRSVDGNIRFPKKGLTRITEQCKDIEILPVVMDGTDHVMRKPTLKINFGQKINVRFLKPFKLEDIEGTEKDKLTYWYNMMSDELKNIRNEHNENSKNNEANDTNEGHKNEDNKNESGQ